MGLAACHMWATAVAFHARQRQRRPEKGKCQEEKGNAGEEERKEGEALTRGARGIVSEGRKEEEWIVRVLRAAVPSWATLCGARVGGSGKRTGRAGAGRPCGRKREGRKGRHG